MDGENTHKEDTVESELAVRKTEDVSAPGVSLSRAPAVAKNWLTELVSGAVEAYAKELKDSPIRTKALTSCVISMLGELIGTALKPRKPDGSRGKDWLWLVRALPKSIVFTIYFVILYQKRLVCEEWRSSRVTDWWSQVTDQISTPH